MKNTGRFVRRNESIELEKINLLNQECDTKKTGISKLRIFADTIKGLIYCAGAPIADDVMENPGRGRRRR